MSLRNLPRLCSIDLAGLAVSAVLAALIVFTQVLPSFRAERELRSVRGEINSAQQRLETASDANNSLAQRAAATEDAVRGLLASAPRDVSAFLKFLTAECGNTDVQIDDIVPADSDNGGTWTVRVRVVGAAPVLLKLLARTEAWSPFARVPRWSVESGADAKQTRMDWTVQLRRPTTVASANEARKP